MVGKHVGARYQPGMESHFFFCHSFGGRKRSWKNPTYYNTYLVIYIYMVCSFVLKFQWTFFEITTVVLLFWPLSCIQLTLPQNSCSICPFKILYSLSISVWDVSIHQWEIDFEPICFAIFAVSHCSRLTRVDSYLGDEWGWLRATNCIQLLHLPWELDCQAGIYLRKLSMEQPKTIENI